MYEEKRCICGGIITGEWDQKGFKTKCSNCDNPVEQIKEKYSIENIEKEKSIKHKLYKFFKLLSVLIVGTFMGAIVSFFIVYILTTIMYGW